MTIRILLVDDQEMVRAALRQVIERRTDLTVVGEADDGHSAVRAARERRPDVIVMDVRMPGLNGVEATREILGEWLGPGTPPRVLVLTTFDVDEYVHDALRAGASGFLLKNGAPEDLVAGIRVVHDGEAMLAPTVTRRLITTFTAVPDELVGPPTRTGPGRGMCGPEALTAREYEVLILLAHGLSNAQIATRLSLSETGVKGRVNRILVRLGLTNRVQAAILAHESGLVMPEPPAETDG